MSESRKYFFGRIDLEPIMIERVRITNFKKISDADIRTPKITILIGPNGSGKSSVIQALVLLRQSNGGDDLIPNGPFLNLGPVADLHSRGAPEASLTLSISGSAFLGEGTHAPLTRRARFSWIGRFGREGVIDNHIFVVDGGREFDLQWSRGATKSIAVAKGPGFEISVQSGRSVMQGFSFSTTTSAGVDGLRVGDEQKMASLLLGLPAREINKVRYVPAARGITEPVYPLLDEGATELSGSSNSIAERILASTLIYNEDVAAKVSEWLQEVLGRTIRARLDKPKNVVVESQMGSARVRLVNEGFGTSQLAMMLAQIALAPRGALIAVEEPESHIHPGAQSKLAALLAKVALSDEKQFVLTTHSEHLVFAFLIQVARGALKPTDLSIYFFPSGAALTTPHEVQVGEKGLLGEKLPGFFDADISQLAEMLDAVSKGG